MTPWPAMLRLAALRFGLAPEAFWRLSLAEWRMLTGEGGEVVMTRQALHDLMAVHPDEAQNTSA